MTSLGRSARTGLQAGARIGGWIAAIELGLTLVLTLAEGHAGELSARDLGAWLLGALLVALLTVAGLSFATSLLAAALAALHPGEALLGGIAAGAYTGLRVVDRLGLQALRGPEAGRAVLLAAGCLCLAVLAGIGAARLLRAGSPSRWTTPRVLTSGAAVAAALWLLLRVLPAPDGREAAAAPGAPGDRNVLLVTIDSLRADRLDAQRMPRVWLLAAQGVRFDTALAQAPWTVPALASLLTARYPSELGLPVSSEPFEEIRRRRLAASALTLAELLHERGFATAAAVTNPWLRPGFGFEQGFDTYHWVGEARLFHVGHFSTVPVVRALRHVPALCARFDAIWTALLGDAGSIDPFAVRAEQVSDDAIAWLAGRREASATAPFFLWLHYSDPHFPFDPPPGLGPQDERLASLRSIPADDVFAGRTRLLPADEADLAALYDGEVAATDRAVGHVLDALDSSGLGARTLVVVTADHGEEFFEHGGFLHGHSLHDEVLRVPLVLVGAGLPRGVARGEVVRQVDVVPTVLGWLGLPVPHDLHGRALLAGPGADSGVSFAEALLRGRELKAVRSATRKLILDPSTGTWQSFDLREDPSERRDLAAQGAEEDAALRLVLEHWLDGTPDTSLATQLDPSGTARQSELRALGY